VKMDERKKTLGFNRKETEFDRYLNKFVVATHNGNSAYGILHPTQKPVALFEYLIRTYTNEGDTVLDNVIGSGTTAVAAFRTGRRWIGMEKDPEIYEKACARIERDTKQQNLFTQSAGRYNKVLQQSLPAANSEHHASVGEGGQAC